MSQNGQEENLPIWGASMSPFRRIQPSALEQNERKAMLYAAFLLSETRQQSYVIQPQGALIAYPTPQQLLLDLCNQQQSYVTQLQGALVSFPNFSPSTVGLV